jgi:hypothetical protein
MKDRVTIATEKAIKKCERGSDAEWIASAIEAIEMVALEQEQFTADDIWRFVDPPREPSALGVALRRAAKAGVCKVSNEYRQSIRPSTHRRPLRVWHSLVHAKPTPDAGAMLDNNPQEALFA